MYWTILRKNLTFISKNITFFFTLSLWLGYRPLGVTYNSTSCLRFGHLVHVGIPIVDGLVVYFTSSYSFISTLIMKKGAQIKSYLISHALILAGFKMWKLKLCTKSLNLLYWHYVNLFYGIVKIRFLCQSTAFRCVFTASTRCVFKIYNVTRFYN